METTLLRDAVITNGKENCYSKRMDTGKALVSREQIYKGFGFDVKVLKPVPVLCKKKSTSTALQNDDVLFACNISVREMIESIKPNGLLYEYNFTS